MRQHRSIIGISAFNTQKRQKNPDGNNDITGMGLQNEARTVILRLALIAVIVGLVPEIAGKIAAGKENDNTVAGNSTRFQGEHQIPLDQKMERPTDFDTALRLKRAEAMRVERSQSLAARVRVLSEKAQQTGLLPVIVRVRAGFVPEGELNSPIEAEAQRFLIQEAQFRLLGEMTGFDQLSIKKYSFLPFVAMRVNTVGLESLLASSTVIDVQEDIAVPPALAQSVALIGGTRAWAAGYTGEGQTVAIIDTGIDKSHPFLTDKVVSEACYSTNSSSQSLSSLCPGGVAASTASGAGLPCGAPGTSCDHGTHVAGIVAGRGQNFSGVAKDATLIAVQTFTQVNTSQICGPGRNTCILAYDSDLVRGLERVYELRNTYKIAAVNMSLGGGRYAANCDSNAGAMKLAIDLLRSANIATIAASGNNGYTDSIGMPACISSAISVGSTTDYSGQPDQVSSYSNSGSILNLLAPGEAINSSVPGGGYANWGGTSMATPHVAGAWAVARQKDPTASVTKILSAFTSSGVKITDSRNNIVKPRIQVDAAIDLLGDVTPPPTAPTAPTALQATAISESQIDLAWTDNSSNETGFRVRRKLGAIGEWVVVATLSANLTSWQNTDLPSGTIYYYTVTAFNATGESAVSNESTATTLAVPPLAPTNLVATARSSSRVDLTWIDNATNETGIRIERRTGANGNWVEVASVSPNATTFLNTGLTAGTTYYYRVIAFNPAGSSESSNIAIVTTMSEGDGGGGQAGAPANLQGAALTPTQVTLSWLDRSDNEAGYRIRRKTGIEGSWAVIANLAPNTTSFQNNGLSSGMTYYYQVSAFNLDGESAPSNEVSITAPSISFIPLNNGLSARSNLLRNQVHYYQINVPIGATRLSFQTTGTGNIDLYVRFGSQPQITVFNCRSANSSSAEQCFFNYPAAGDWHVMIAGYSNNISFYNLTATFQSGTPNDLPAAPTNLSARSVSPTQISLSWSDNSSNELVFRIRRRTENDGVWMELPPIGQNINSYIDSNVSPGLSYYYSVTSLNGSGASAASNEVMVMTSGGETLLPAPPLGLTAAAVSASLVNLNWTDSATNETGFRVQRRTGAGGAWTDNAVVAQNLTTYQDVTVAAGQTYSYRVIAFNTAGDSTPSNEATVTMPGTPSAPVGLQVLLVSPTQATLTWTDTSANETGFRIRRRIGSTGTWSEIGTVGQNFTTFSNSGLPAGTTFFYRVTSYNAVGESAESNEVGVSTPGVNPVPPVAPGGLAASANSSSQVTLSWIDNSNDELGFRIRRKTASSSGWLEVGTVSANVTAFQNVGLSPATTYLYQVIAFNSFGDSTPSNEIDATTLAQASNAISLSNGRASTGALPKNQSILYRLSVPANVAQLVIQTKGIGNADLYVRYGAQPQLNAFDCRSNGPTSSEQCIISRPVAGDWNIMVFGNTSSLSVYSVIGSYGTESTLGFDISRK